MRYEHHAIEQALYRRRRALLHGADDVDALSPAEQHELTRVGRALSHIHRGTYGVCAECGRPIERTRLSALPWTTECARCLARRSRS